MLGRRHRNSNAARQSNRSFWRTGWLVTAFLFLILLIPSLAWAQTASDQLAGGLEATSATGLSTTDIRVIVSRIINAFFGLLGLVAVTLFMYAGYIYMTARGDAAQLDRAKQIMVSAVVGLIILLSAYAIAQFIIRAILGGASGTPGGSTGTGGSALTAGYCQGCGPEQLGNGIISSHYPEANQRDVPRNASIAISFKKPVLPSTLLKDYDDKGTYEQADDEVCTPDCADPGATRAPITPTTVFHLNDANVKIVPANDLGEVSGASLDERFDNRYDSTAVLIGTAAALTPVEAVNFDPNNLGQTIVITPPITAPLGSSQTDVEYRVGLRGGDNGIQVWGWDAVAGAPKLENAFSRLNPDGSYFWNFTTGTLLDLTPPQVTHIVPVTRTNPETEPLFRNQLLQIYFSKPMNPTTVTGYNGSGGFNLVEVLADTGSGFQPLDGNWVVSQGYRAIEFTPDAPCNGVSQNSCGDDVFCLPADADLAVAVRAAGLSDSPPRAALPLNGVVDMVSNSLDGDGDGTVEGPGGVNPTAFSGNLEQLPGSTLPVNFSADSLLWLYTVGDQVDLIPPKITSLDPPNINPGQVYPVGQSKFPVDQDIIVKWDKTMSIGSIITGPDTYSPATVTLRSEEPHKSGATDVGSASFTVEPSIENDRSVMTMKHRPFFTANDLGWLPTDPNPDLPVYIPVFKARLRDTRQNCFYPSEAINCTGSGQASPYCCDDEVGTQQAGRCNPTN
jgi:hypothetical protein